MTRKITVTIVVPAYNEEQNIAHVLNALLKQSATTFSLKEIVVISDGSSDRTVEIAASMRSSKIRIVDGKQRKGKPRRLNDAYRLCTTDVLVQFDADIIPRDSKTLEYLVNPYTKINPPDVVYGNSLPVKPNTLTGKLVLYGLEAWKVAISKAPNKERYLVSGTITAFSKKFLQEFRYPTDEYVTEDTYGFFYAKKHGYKTFYQENAAVYFKLAESYREYADQMNRYMTTVPDMARLFGPKMLSKYETITTKMKLMSLFRYALTRPPHFFVGYIILHAYPKIRESYFKQKELWDIAESSKQSFY